MSEVGRYRTGQTEVHIRRRSCGTPEGAIYTVPSAQVRRPDRVVYRNLKPVRGIVPEQQLQLIISQFMTMGITEAAMKVVFATHFNTIRTAKCGGG